MGLRRIYRNWLDSPSLPWILGLFLYLDFFSLSLSKRGLLIKSIPDFSIKNKYRLHQNTCSYSTLNSVLQSCFSLLCISKGQIAGPCAGDFQTAFPTHLVGPLFLISLLVNAKLFCYHKSFMLILL